MYFTTRPRKHAKLLPPLYSTSNGSSLTYCHTCGRIISTRCKNASENSATPVKYCSDRCRSNKPGHTDRLIEEAIVALLEGCDPNDMEKYWAGDEAGKQARRDDNIPHVAKRERKKGDSRIIVYCSDIQALVFGHQRDPEKLNGKRGHSGSRCVVDFTDWRSVDMEDTSDHCEPSVKSSSDHLKENEKTKREQGRKRAEEREMVRRAARRGVAFGFRLPDTGLPVRAKSMSHNGKKKQDKRKEHPSLIGKNYTVPENLSGPVIKYCEAVMTDAAIVVEPSFAKGDWGIRWREE
ncbi:hypothetical protein GcM1_238011 [Golovinomyces cichoracearum]|uniref:Uncharacterized protein n=1 Tax=Golovinomyces cichoracearum TaxID=62708 RepID=A0A420IJ44_9PEZI|nr:hypothetical protein GcM1_238011 [Golovinomyces cichoracearum]